MMNKKLTLDVAKWRCGEGGKYSLGEGPTKLLNECGYMCCLGQFALQLGYTEAEIKQRNYPADICSNEIDGLIRRKVDIYILNSVGDTDFSELAATINDDKETTPKTKIQLLKSLCAEYKCELIVKNEHLLEAK